MSTVLTLAAYLGRYAAYAEFQQQAVLERAARSVEIFNAAIQLAEADGVEFKINPNTGTIVAGSGNGGVRPANCPVGAANSRHKIGKDELGPAALDLFDFPARDICRWSLANADRLKAVGVVAMERPQWTPSWCHWQTVPVRSGLFAFVPSSEPALVAALPGETVA